MLELNPGIRGWALNASVHPLAGWTEIAGASQVLDLLNGRPTIGTGTADCILVHDANVSATVVVKIIFVVPTAFLHDHSYRIHDGVIENPGLIWYEIRDRKPWMDASTE
jgi:hypothetical protein